MKLHKIVKPHPLGRCITTDKYCVFIFSFCWICDPVCSEVLLSTDRVPGVEAGAVHHQQLNHLKSVDSHCIVHWCVSILDRT